MATITKQPWALWTVDGVEYKLKLTTDAICKLEDKYDKNLLMLLGDYDLPPLKIMLSVIHSAMQAYEHGVKFPDVMNIFDKYIEEGGTQADLLKDVLMPTLSVSGFFTQTQMADMMEETTED